MVRTKSMTRNPNHDNTTSRKRFNTSNNGGVRPWPDLNNDMLFLLMMQLGVIDFVSFSGVCKSWRSFALSNRKKFMASRPPMSIWIRGFPYRNECYLKDFEGRKFKTILPDSAGRTCVGLTCGYLILMGEETHDFWLMNPITRHELYFPAVPCLASVHLVRAILVFSPSISSWVFFAVDRYSMKIWFYVAGKGTWRYVPSTFPVVDLHAFKGRIYILGPDWRLCEMTIGPKPILTLLTKEHYWKTQVFPPKFASSGENLYVVDRTLEDPDIVLELDFGKMKWVLPEEKTIREYVFFLSVASHGVAIKPNSWSQDKRYNCFPDIDNSSSTDLLRKCGFFSTSMWYFPHLCLDVDILDDL